MRTLNEYTELVRTKYQEDNPVTGISLKECVDIVADNAFFRDEIVYQTIELLKSRLLKELNLT